MRSDEVQRLLRRTSWFDVCRAGALVSRATFMKIARARSLLAMAEAMQGHAKARRLRARAQKLIHSLPAVLRDTAREWINDVGPVVRHAPLRRARRVRT